MNKIPKHIYTLDGDILIAAEAALAAGKIIVHGYGKTLEIREKSIGNLVSDIDNECDLAVRSIIKKSRPKDRILSEELSPDTIDNGNRTWIVDPLDATSGFLFKTGRDITSVMVALRDKGKTILSVIYFPLSNSWYYALKGVGCFKDGERIRISGSNVRLKNAWIDMNHYGDEAFETEDFKRLDRRLRSAKGAKLVTRMVPHSGVVTKIIEEEQKLSAVIHDNNSHSVKQAPWDIIPARLLLEEAGGVVVNFSNERLYPYVQEPFIAARTAKIAEEIITLLDV